MTRTLVTGGTRGIGAAIAERLAEAGHDLVLGYVHDDAAAELAAGRRGDARRGLHAGAGRPARRPTVSTRCSRAAGPLTGVVNNAGATFHIGPLADTPVEVIRRTIDLNLTSAILVARAAVLAMGTAYGGAGGVLVNISSGAATRGAPGEYVQYAAAKAGVDALTLGLAEEVAAAGRPGGRCRARDDPHDHPRRRRRARPARAGRAARSRCSAPASPRRSPRRSPWLMSDAASYVTGTTLRVAGGR